MTDPMENASATDSRTARISDSIVREVSTDEAVGMVLAHDLTRIVPGEFKGRLFRKGHVVTDEDIPKLKDIGKENLYVIELAKTDLHEDDVRFRRDAAIKTVRKVPVSGRDNRSHHAMPTGDVMSFQ